MYFTQNLPYRKWVKVTQKWYGKKWVKLDWGAEVGVLFWGVGRVWLSGGEEYSAGLVVDADGVVADEVHSQNPVEASAFVKIKVYDCYWKV